MNALPAGWVDTTLEKVVMPPRAKASPQDHPELPFVGMDQIAPGSMSLLGTSLFGDTKSNGGLFFAGDVLYGRMRPYLNKVHRAKFKGACSAEFIVLPKSEVIEGDFLAYLLHDRRFVNFASERSAGDRPRVDFGSLSSYEFALPPKREQQRIASKIDELFSRIEEGERALERAQKLVERYRQSVLKAAVTGELTREWREQRQGQLESGEALLQRILKARRETCEQAELDKMKAAKIQPVSGGWRQKYGEPAAPDVSDAPELPAGWIWSSLGQLFKVSIGSTPSRKEPTYWNGDIPWVSSGEVAFCRIKETKEQISSLGFQHSSVKMHPPGTVLLAMIGEGKTRGQAAILDISACHNQNAASIGVAQTPIPPEYVYHFLMYRYETVRSIGQGGNQPALNGSLVKSISIPLPPLAEIIEICDTVNRQLSAIEVVEADLARQQKLIDAQRQAVLREAFAGTLVAQHADDEAADMLLERISAECTARVGSSKLGLKRTAKA